MSARVLVVGLDAADPGLARELADRGEMPNLATLFATGSGQPVTNPDAFFVSAVWPTLFTGTSPGHHGRIWPGRLHPGTYQVRPFPPDALRVDPFWVSLARAGHRVAVVNAPHAPVTGEPGLTEVIDWGGHEPASDFQASSPTLADEIRRRFGTHPVDSCDGYAARSQVEQLVADLRVGLERKIELTTFLLDRDDWDLFFGVISECHCAGHQCWHLHDREHPKHDPVQADVLGDPVVDTYRQVDAALGELLARADDDTEVFVLLSHGMGPHYDGTVMVNEILRRLEVAWNRRPSRWAVRRNQLDHAWNRVARKAHLRPERTWMLDGSRPFIRAPNASACAAIRINVTGREPAGTVAPGAEYEEVCAALTDEFRALVNVETGAPAVERVLRPAEVFDGPQVKQMPDLVIMWCHDGPIEALASPTIGRVEGRYHGHRTGDHRRDGMLLRRGPAAPATTAGIDARELAPMVHALLGVPFTPVR